MGESAYPRFRLGGFGIRSVCPFICRLSIAQGRKPRRPGLVKEKPKIMGLDQGDRPRGDKKLRGTA
jgi:hypothetical protein